MFSIKRCPVLETAPTYLKKKQRLRNKTYTTSSPPTSTISNTTNNPNKYIEIKCIFF